MTEVTTVIGFMAEQMAVAKEGADIGKEIDQVENELEIIQSKPVLNSKDTSIVIGLLNKLEALEARNSAFLLRGYALHDKLSCVPVASK